MKKDYYYDIELPEKVTAIIEQEFWVYDHVSALVLRSFLAPVKFSSFTSIYVRKGKCKASINLMEYEIEAPCIVNVWGANILQPKELDPDFDAAFLVLSPNLTETIFADLSTTPYTTLINRYPIVSIPEKDIEVFNNFYEKLIEIQATKDNPYISKVLVHTLLAFFYANVNTLYLPLKDRFPASQGRLVDRFIQLVQENFKTERFLDYYAKRMEITSKHLSRSVKKQTGFTAVEWIERFVILEAKALLKSSSLNIQQIADELNFPSQSFFGKYFKKFTGMSPKEFRNS